jgi:hypothetical protein
VLAVDPPDEEHLNVRLTVLGWRHVAIGIATRRLMQDTSKIWGRDGEDDAEDGADDFADRDD